MVRFVTKSILFFIPLFGFSYPQEFYEAYFEGESLLARGEYEKAVDCFEAALRISELKIELKDTYYDRHNSERYEKWHSGDRQIKHVNCDENSIALYSGFYRVGYIAYRIIQTSYYMGLSLESQKKHFGIAKSASSIYGQALLELAEAQFCFKERDLERTVELAKSALFTVNDFGDIDNKCEAMFIISYVNYLQ